MRHATLGAGSLALILSGPAGAEPTVRTIRQTGAEGGLEFELRCPRVEDPARSAAIEALARRHLEGLRALLVQEPLGPGDRLTAETDVQLSIQPLRDPLQLRLVRAPQRGPLQRD